jgi:hypothetical protein
MTNGELVFSDRQAHRMERAMANMEFGFGEGGYQPSEFIKRYLPQGTFDLLIADEAHEYKNGGSPQGQAMGVLAAKARKTLAAHRHADGRLRRRPVPPAVPSPAWADDRRRLPPDQERQHDVGRDGVHARSRRPQGHLFREHGHGAQDRQGHQGIGAHGQGAGFGPKGVLRCVLPFTVFLKLKDIGGNVLPPYDEEFREVTMDTAQAAAYRDLAAG